MPPFSPYSSTFSPFSTNSPPPSGSRSSALTTLANSAQGAVAHYVPNMTYQEPPHEHRQQSLNMQATNHGLWTYNPVFGIVHSFSDGCGTCNAYMQHIALAMTMNTHDTSFLQAAEARKESQDTFFMDGFGEGMRHQRDNDLPNVERLQAALDAVDKGATENERLRMELAWTKQQLARYEESKYLKAPSSPMDILPSRPSPSTSGAMGTGSRASSLGSSMEFQPHSTSQLSDFSSPWPSRNPEPHEVGNSATQSLSSYASVASSRFPAAPASHHALHLPMKPDLIISGPPYGEFHSTVTLRSPCDNLRGRHPKNLKELKDLMELAREPTNEGAAALSIVKSFCSRAHNTPRDDKNFMQRWVLMNWKNPYAMGSAPSKLAADAKPNPRIDDPVDVWYEYLCAHPHSWPKGVRKDALGKPIMSDLVANRAVARMRPTESAASRNDFIAHVTDIFAIPGMYKQLLEENNLAVTPEVSYKPFTGPISIDTIVRHFAESGLTPADATKNFEPWAQNYKEY